MGRNLCRARSSIGASPRTGLTLLEVVVTLVVLGLAAALVSPAITPPHPDPDAERSRLIARSRESAVQRAQDLVLVIDSSGAWRLFPAATPAEGRTGRGLAPQAPLTLRVSSLGGCLVEKSRDTVPFDLACNASSSRR